MAHRTLTGTFAVCLLSCLAARAQQPLTVAKLTSFIKSSQTLKQSDAQVAEVLKSCRMTEQLDEAAIEELQNLGAGPKTVQVLKVLAEKSVGLGAAKPVEAEARPRDLSPPSATEQDRILEQVRQYALNYTGNLPDFICTETTTRSEAPLHGIGGAPSFHKVDTLTAKLTYFQQREEYKVKCTMMPS